MKKTLESIFIKQYEDKQSELDSTKKENEVLTQRVEWLENTYLNKPLEVEDKTEDKRKLLPTFKILYKQDVMAYYNYKELKTKHTLEYFKNLLTDEKKLMRFMNEKRETSYSHDVVMEVKKHEVNHYCEYGNETLYFKIYFDYDNILNSNSYSLRSYYLTEEEAFEVGKKEVIENIKRYIKELEKAQSNG